jgi:uncharacterized OB-fold protein
MEPTTDLDSAPFFDGLRRHEVIVQCCTECGRARFGRLGSCPHCGTLGGHDVTVSGRGVVYSFVRVHRALSPAMAGEVPYAVGTIELENGARLLGRVEPVEACAIGVPVEPEFVDHGTWTELRFAVTG